MSNEHVQIFFGKLIVSETSLHHALADPDGIPRELLPEQPDFEAVVAALRQAQGVEPGEGEIWNDVKLRAIGKAVEAYLDQQYPEKPTE